MSRSIDVFMTYGQGGWNQQFRQTVLFGPGETENRVINLYPESTGQVFDGFGGAITEAAGYVYAQLNAEQKKTVMETYFSPDRMNYQFVRIPIDSCDFSLSPYAASSLPDLSDFSLERAEKYIFPMLDDAERAAGRRIPILLSPWSPPAYMKTNGDRLHGGKLKDEYRHAWAEYLCRYISAFRERGYHVRALTLQNEAKAVQPWDSCVFTAEEEKRFLRDFVWPAMQKHQLTDVAVYIWDHNKERVFEWMRDIIDEETSPMIAGAAVHWYSGDHFDALDLCRRRFPDKKIILSESCIEFCKFDVSDSVGAAMLLSHEVMGDLNHGISAFFDWNMILDAQGGPNHAAGYCLAPFHYDSEKQKLMPHLIARYYEHFARAVRPGAVRIETTRFSEAVEVTAWKNPDRTLTGVLINRTEETQPVFIRLEEQEAALALFPQSIASFRIREEGGRIGAVQ